jgi:hypothetical protein
MARTPSLNQLWQEKNSVRARSLTSRPRENGGYGVGHLLAGMTISAAVLFVRLLRYDHKRHFDSFTNQTPAMKETGAYPAKRLACLDFIQPQ